MNTQKFEIGQEIEVKNYRGSNENFVGIIVNIRNILEKQLQKNTIKRNKMLRSHQLFTVFDSKNGIYRSFYDCFMENL